MKNIILQIIVLLGLLTSAHADTVIITKTKVVDVTPTITAGAYSTGDQVGGLLIFPSAASGSVYTGVVSSVEIVDKAAQGVDMELWLFDASISVVADSAPAGYSDADLAKLVCVIPISEHYVLVDNGASQAQNINCIFELPATTILYGVLVARGTPTYASTSDLTIRLGVLQD